MKKVDSILLPVMLLAATGGAPVLAQIGNSSINPAESRTIVQSDVGVAPLFPQMFEVIANGGLLNDRLVKNQPLAAVFESETIGLQPNGASLTSRVVTKIYRDSDGRTRREQTVLPSGAAASSANATISITIEDPIARFTYLINQTNRTALRYKLPLNHSQGNGFNDLIPRTVELLRNDDPQTGLVRNYRLEQPRVEPLGRQEISGVDAEGRRVRFKIPAGAIGNTTEIEATHETWIARDLKMLVKSNTKNSIIGEHKFRLIELVRAEQPASLFEIPSNYTIQESGIVRTDLPPPY